VAALAAIAGIGLDVDTVDQTADFGVLAARHALALDALQPFHAGEIAAAAIRGVAGQIGAGPVAACDVAGRAAGVAAGAAIRLVALQIDALAAATRQAASAFFRLAFAPTGGGVRDGAARRESERAAEEQAQQVAARVGLDGGTDKIVEASRIHDELRITHDAAPVAASFRLRRSSVNDHDRLVSRRRDTEH
jgi:hypothetical protein